MSDGGGKPTDDPPVRKRVGKACDRCRNKKSKCDGALPCNRCREDNVVCLFGERDKAQDKVWPRGTVELQQKALGIYEDAILELYTRLVSGFTWGHPPVAPGGDGRPLIHDILVAMETCKPDCSYFQDIEEKIGSVMKNDSSQHPSLKPLPKDDMTVKMEPQEPWPASMPMSAQENSPLPSPASRKGSQDNPYPLSPPNELTHPPTRSFEQMQVPGSLGTRRRRNSHTANMPSQLALPSPDLSPEGEINSQVPSGYDVFGYPHTYTPSMNPYATAPPTGGFPSYEGTPFGGLPYEQALDHTQQYGWPNPQQQQSGSEQLVLASMIGDPASYNPYGFIHYGQEPS